jgi:hypothetical protein
MTETVDTDLLLIHAWSAVSQFRSALRVPGEE